MSSSRPPFRPPMAVLLFCSGFCALVYQTVWLREFRLIFGASTAACAAVLGIFMGGLGLGSAWLGRRGERVTRPLHFYGNLELLIAISAAITPGLVWVARQAYAATGGGVVLGTGFGTIVRLILAMLVLIVPTFLMGGTLPAVARAAEADEDVGRRRLALFYGWNTLGAVTGATVSTFWMLEMLGNRSTLWAAAAVNALIGLLARQWGKHMPALTEAAPGPETTQKAILPARVIMAAAALVGFAFMLMELVWYRMLAPILGGTTFTFGLILMVALLGIGLGGGLYALVAENRRPTANGFALSCALEAFFIALPFALGDRLALLALHLRPLGNLGFFGQVFGWAIVAGVVILPAALVAGYQFPMLIALLGQGREEVARQTGFAYAANTGGAIIGSLAGGFWILPHLTALRAWQFVFLLLAGTALIMAILGNRRGERLSRLMLVIVGLVVMSTLATGPTAVWRHSGIGAGRVGVNGETDKNAWRSFANQVQRTTYWEAEGIESSVALGRRDGLAFVVNGKVDGNSRGDAGTQIMAGMLGGLLHKEPKRALVIGLGTGSTAGWLASIPSMERVDVVELEPSMVEVARRCAAVNQDVLNHPKVHLHLGDAREVLLTTPARYDIVFSEPSNPYRSGIASLFTKEFYEATEHRLASGGIFLQWLQTYEVDAGALQTVYATLGSVFPQIQTWQTLPGDFLLVATREPIVLDPEQLRPRIAAEPFRSALLNGWRVDTFEGMLAFFVADENLARAVQSSEVELCLDDRNLLEFGFARSVGRLQGQKTSLTVMNLARERQWHRPQVRGVVDWNIVEGQIPMCEANMGRVAEVRSKASSSLSEHRLFIDLYFRKAYGDAKRWMERRGLQPLSPFEAEAMGWTCAAAGDEKAMVYAQKIALHRPSDAEAIRARLLMERGEYQEAADAMAKVVVSWRKDPWVSTPLGQMILDEMVTLARTAKQPGVTASLWHALEQPFAVFCFDEKRMMARMSLTNLPLPPMEPNPLSQAIDEFGPYVPWTREFLGARRFCFRLTKDPREAQATRDLEEFLGNEPIAFRLPGTTQDNAGNAKPETNAGEDKTKAPPSLELR